MRKLFALCTITLTTSAAIYARGVPPERVRSTRAEGRVIRDDIQVRRRDLSRIGFDAVGDRVSDVLFGDHAGHVGPAWHAASAAHDHRHDGVPAPYAADNIEGGLILVYHGEVAAGDIPEAQTGMGAFQSSAKTCVDADHAVDVAFVSDYDVAQAPSVLRLT
jgi:hypothetical protein